MKWQHLLLLPWISSSLESDIDYDTEIKQPYEALAADLGLTVQKLIPATLERSVNGTAFVRELLERVIPEVWKIAKKTSAFDHDTELTGSRAVELETNLLSLAEITARLSPDLKQPSTFDFQALNHTLEKASLRASGKVLEDEYRLLWSGLVDHAKRLEEVMTGDEKNNFQEGQESQAILTEALCGAEYAASMSIITRLHGALVDAHLDCRESSNSTGAQVSDNLLECSLGVVRSMSWMSDAVHKASASMDNCWGSKWSCMKPVAASSTELMTALRGALALDKVCQSEEADHMRCQSTYFKVMACLSQAAQELRSAAKNCHVAGFFLNKQLNKG